MKTEKTSFTRWFKSWPALGMIGSLVVIAIFVSLPHRIKIIESQATLQSGKKMDVKFTLRSAWGWSEPDRLSKMEVTLDGHNIPINSAAYSGSIPLKASQPPIIVEKAGFPEVIALGKTGNAVKQANWSFMNYGLSQRQVISAQGRSDTFYSPNPTQIPTGLIQLPQKIQMSGLATGGSIKQLGN